MGLRGWVVVAAAVGMAALLGACQSPDARALLESKALLDEQGLAAKRGGMGYAQGESNAAARGAGSSSSVAVSRYKPAGKSDIVEGTGRTIGDGPRARAEDGPRARAEDGPRARAEDEPRERREPPTSGELVTLNMVDGTAAQAAKAVLGDMLGVPYVVDAKVQGKVSIATPEPVTRTKMAALFEAALQTAGATVVDGGGVYRVVPATEAATSGIVIHLASHAGNMVGANIEVVQLQYVSAADMKRLLEPMTPKGTVVRADDARNVLTLQGGAAERGIVKDALAIFDIDTMKGNTFAIVPVKSPDVDGLADDVRQVFATDKEGPLAGIVRVIGNKRLSAILVISPQKRYIARAETWIRKLDARAQGSEKQFYTYRVQNRSAKELVSILTSMFSGDMNAGAQGTGSVAPRSSAVTVASPGLGGTGSLGAGASNGFAPGIGMGSAASVSPSAAAGSFGTQGTLTGTSSPPSGGNSPQASQISLGDDSRFKVAVDEAKNSVIVLASPDDYRRLLGMIHSLDQLPNQVLIEAVIAEVTLTDELRFGVRWYLQKNNTNSATFTNDPAGSIAAVFPGFNYILKAASSQVTLDALAHITTVNVVSSPSLTVLDNKTATLQVGDQVPITTQTATSTLTTGAPLVNSVSYRDTGVILGITPHINESGRVILDIEQEVSSVSQTTSSNIDSPTIQQRKIKTSVVLNDGQALALGGLIQNKRSKAKDQVPLFGDIPVLGNAFKQKDDTETKTELVIMIVPRVIRSLGEAAAISAEFREKVDQIAPGAMAVPSGFRPQVRRLLE